MRQTAKSSVSNWRILRPFSGMVHDLKLRAPWYIGDWVGKEDIYRDPETAYRLVSGYEFPSLYHIILTCLGQYVSSSLIFYLHWLMLLTCTIALRTSGEQMKSF